MTQSITFSFCLMPAYAHIQLRERTHIEESGGEREVGRGVRGRGGERRVKEHGKDTGCLLKKMTSTKPLKVLTINKPGSSN